MRYTGSLYRKSRRLGFSLLENDKEFTKGKARTTRPGQHGDKKIKMSNYGQQLQEKQKLMYLYGLNDRQFRRLFLVAKKRKGATTLNLLQVLESRLDSLVFKAGFAPTRRAARQLVSHGHIVVNGKKCNIPSIILNIGDKVAVAKGSLEHKSVKETTRPAADFLKANGSASKEVEILRMPERHELPENINEAYVVEWFNRLM